MRSLCDAAQNYLGMGLCILPADGPDKKPTVSWKRFQKRLPSESELAVMMRGASAICVITGEVSGNLEALDFDLAGEMWEPWLDCVRQEDPELPGRLVIETTPSGGRHVLYRCCAPVCGNAKLATKSIKCSGPESVQIAGKSYVPRAVGDGTFRAEVAAIETRGEGGLLLCAPSPSYELVQGSVTDLPVLSPEERETLLSAARSLNEVWEHHEEERPPQQHGHGGRPGDEFNERGDVRPILERHGWRLVRAGDNEHWCRPGKDRGTSATLKGGVFFVFSSNAPPFQAGKAYSRFSVYTMLEHGGYFPAAAAGLRRQGFGTSSRSGSASSHDQEEEWPDPLPLRLRSAGPPFPITEAFPPGLTVIREYVLALAETYQVPVDLPAMQLLPIVGLCVAQKVVLQPAPDWQEVPAIWTLSLLPSGSRKTPVLSRLTEPVRSWERDEADRLGPDIAKQQQEMQVRETRMKRFRGILAKDSNDSNASDELNRLATEAAKEKALCVPHLIVSEPTPEALAAYLGRNEERGLLASAEADALDVALGRYSDGKANLGVFLSGYSGERIRIARKSGDVFLDRPVLNMVLAVQHEAIRQLLCHRQAKGRGMLARFLYSMPRDLVGRRRLDPDPLPHDLDRRYRSAIRRLLAREIPEAPVIVGLSRRAFALLQEFRRDHERRMQLDGDLGSRREWAAKEVGGLARIALVLETVANSVNSANCAIGEVSEESMRAALALAPYLEQHQLLAESILGVSPELEQAEKILSWVQKESLQSFSRRDCYRVLGCRPDDVDDPLKLLEDHNWIQNLGSKRKDGPGRNPSPTFTVNPKAFQRTLHTAQSAQSTEWRADDDSGESVHSAACQGDGDGDEDDAEAEAIRDYRAGKL